MPSKEVFYAYGPRLANEERLIDTCPTTVRNREVMRAFLEFNLARGLSVMRAVRLAQAARQVALVLGRNFEGVTRVDIQRAVVAISARPDWSGWTKQSLRVTLRLLYKYLAGTREVPELVAWVETRLRRDEQQRTYREEELPVEVDLQRALAVARTPLEVTFVSVLEESGARPGELLLLDRRNATFERDVAILEVNGKTGPREILLVRSARVLAAYMEATSDGATPDTPLWRTAGSTYPFLTAESMRAMLRRLYREAGIPKRALAYLWRHARITNNAKNGMTHAQLCTYFGWKYSSPMPDRYIHMTARSIEPVIRHLHVRPDHHARPQLVGRPTGPPPD
ncbi:MAG: site-specific integrase [Deltaproteobacteria bacterium]|nr:site-specific integrase [Deltaproteobacteria bacterium]